METKLKKGMETREGQLLSVVKSWLRVDLEELHYVDKWYNITKGLL